VNLGVNKMEGKQASDGVSKVKDVSEVIVEYMFE